MGSTKNSGRLKQKRFLSCAVSLLTLFELSAVAGSSDTTPSLVEQKIEALQVGSQIYSNVTITARSARQITIMHTKGVASVKLDDLTPDIQANLGYDPEKNGKKKKGLSLSKTFSMQSVHAREFQATLGALVGRYGEIARIGALVALPVLYLFCCFCFLLVCRKAGVKASVKVWIPLLQFDPLFKAAGMSRISLFWFVSPLVLAVGCALFVMIAGFAGAPPDLFKGPKLVIAAGGLQGILSIASLMVGFVWCFKICIARGKNAWLGVLLILPLTNLLTLGYLAFSRGMKERSSSSQLKLA